MQQMLYFNDSAWNGHDGVQRFNRWMQEHPSCKIVALNVVPLEGYHIYAVAEIPEEDKDHE